jgi:hypothetical protein
MYATGATPLKNLPEQLSSEMSAVVNNVFSVLDVSKVVTEI